MALFWPLLAVSALAAVAARAPNTKACCAAAGVSRYCTEQFCNVEQPPDYFAVFKIAARCPPYLAKIANCLADGRNHEPCCRSDFRDDLSCLHLCNGTAPVVNTTEWGRREGQYRHGSASAYGRYVSCLSFNIKNIFSCMQTGYSTSPGPPSQATATRVTQRSAHIAWQAPDKLPEKVKEYVVYYRKMAGFTRTVESAKSASKSLSLRNLSPDTKYEVYVVAIAKSGSATSLRSDATIFVTKGVAPKVEPRSDNVLASKNSVITLVCTVEVFGSQHISDINLEWLKFSGDRYRPLSGRRTGTEAKHINYSYPRHISADGRNTFLMTLKLNRFDQPDIGSYKCVARNRFGDDSAIISVRHAPVPEIPTNPRNISACCIAESERSHCPGLCKSGEKVAESGAPNLKCAIVEINIMLKCSTEGLDYKPCCLRERVPDRCLPFCDGSMEFSSGVSMFQCFEHTSSIVRCHQEALMGFPDPPHNVGLKAVAKDTLQVTWDPVPDAERYLVYYRRTGRGGPWSHATSLRPNLTLRALVRNASYDVLVLAANRAGFSDNSTPMYIDLRRNMAFYARLR